MSKLLIRDRFEEYERFDKINKTFERKQISSNIKNFINMVDNKTNNFTNESNTDNNLRLNIKTILENEIDFIEHIENDYDLGQNEIKYKIFEDISSIRKIDQYIELELEIPHRHNIISINKIKIPNKLKKYITRILLYVGDRVYNYDYDIDYDIDLDDYSEEEYNIDIKKINNIRNDNKIIDKNYKSIKLCLVLKKNAINEIIDKNIFISYSFAIFKNKFKYI